MEKNIPVARGIFATGISVTLEHQVALILSQYIVLYVDHHNMLHSFYSLCQG
jgi:hypothetical protein